MKKRKKKVDPLIEAIRKVFPDAIITEGYKATKKAMKHFHDHDQHGMP